jgi:cobalt-zinc-cadmium efflux system membrane fusion protein
MMNPYRSIFWGLAVTFTSACAAKPLEEPAPKPRDRSGRVSLTREEVASAKLIVQPIEEREVGETIETSGRVAFDDLLVAHVFSPVNGRVTKILAQPGTRVKKGAPLAIIESPDLGQAYADLGKAEADLTAAEHEYSRQKDLFEAKAGSKKDFETAEDNYHKALAELARAKQKARLLRADQVDDGSAGRGVTQEYTLRSPIDGEVIARNVNPAIEITGQYSNGNAPELFTVGELDRVFVYADLFDHDLARVKEGAAVSVSVAAYRGRSFPGIVEWVSDALDPVTRTARVRCRLDNADHALKPEMYAKVRVAAAGTSAPVVPRTAVITLGDQTVVYVHSGRDEDGRETFERRLVAVDEDQGRDLLPVLKNLKAGDQVVTSGALLLSEMN